MKNKTTKVQLPDGRLLTIESTDPKAIAGLLQNHYLHNVSPVRMQGGQEQQQQPPEHEEEVLIAPHTYETFEDAHAAQEQVSAERRERMVKAFEAFEAAKHPAANQAGPVLVMPVMNFSKPTKSKVAAVEDVGEPCLGLR
jgi:hypothetical protein